MNAKRILYLNTHRLSAFVWKGGHIVPEGSFEPNPEQLAQFTEYLGTHTASPFLILCNVAEESHQVEVIPFLRGRDRKLLIERKISQLFFGTSLATSTSLGYEKDRRKNERVLLSALTNPGHLQPWLNCIAAAEVPLAGVHTVSQLGGQILRRAARLPPRCLLLTMQDHSIRESYLVDGTPVFSRMAPLFDSSVAGIANAFAAEAPKLHQYLAGQRQIGRNDTLPVFIVAHPQAVSAVRSACSGPAALEYEILDSDHVAARLGLLTPPADARCDYIFLHLLATAPPREQYVADELRHDYHLHRIKSGLLGVGALALLAALLFAGKQLAETHLNRSESSELARAEQELEQRYRQIATTFPQLGIGNDTLRRVAGRYQELRRVQKEPGGLYRAIGRAMDQSPTIELEGIEWRLGSAAGPAATGGGVRTNLLEAGDEIAVVKGIVHLDRDAQPRQVLAVFDQFVALLQTGPEVRITPLQRPFDIESGRILRGGTREDENPQPRSFTIQITRRLPA